MKPDSAKIVIIGGGSMAALIADMADITMPIQPRKGQIVVITSVGKKILNRCMNSAKYIAAKYDPEIGTDEG